MALASVALNNARTLLNDDAGSLFTDVVLIPKLQDAHRELQNELWLAGSPMLRKTSGDLAVAIAATTLTSPTDLVEPIKLWEKTATDAVTLYLPMTEVPKLPFLASAATLRYWEWSNSVFIFIGPTVAKTVRIFYRCNIVVPTVAGSDLFIVSAELYLGPMTAALAAVSVGNTEVETSFKAKAKENLQKVIRVNKGRLFPFQTPGRP